MCSLLLCHRGHGREERGGSGARPQADTCPSGVFRKGMCPGRYKNAQEAHLPQAEGISWVVRHREKALDRKDQTAFSNLDKLKVDTTQRFNSKQGQERRHQRLGCIFLFCFFITALII